MPPLEKKIVNDILTMIRSRGGFAVKLHGSIFMQLGLPDIIVCYRGWFLAFEVKRDARPAKKIQQFMLERIRKAGGVALRIHTVEAVSKELDRIDELEHN
jgi:Holliday junction resolvase